MKKVWPLLVAMLVLTVGQVHGLVAASSVDSDSTPAAWASSDAPQLGETKIETSSIQVELDSATGQPHIIFGPLPNQSAP